MMRRAPESEEEGASSTSQAAEQESVSLNSPPSRPSPSSALTSLSSRSEVVGRKEGAPPLIVKQVPVTAVVLAAKSSFFLKLFTSGLSESLNRTNVTIHLTVEEEPIMMELLRFIYKGATSPHITESFELTLQLLMLADRFGVEECFDLCVKRLNDTLSHVTAREALCVLELPKLIQDLPVMRSLGHVSRTCLAEHYGPLLSQPDSNELLSLPTVGLRVLLQSDNLDVESEEIVFTALLAWARHNFQDLELRKSIVENLLEDVRLPWMSAAYIKSTVMTAPEMETDSSQKFLLSALVFMAARGEEEEFRMSVQRSNSLGWCRPRRNSRPAVKSAYLDIPLSYCKMWQPNAGFQATSGTFCVKGKWFTLNAKLELQKEGGSRFGLFLRLEKQVTFPRGETEGEVNCEYRFCVKTSAEGHKFEVAKARSSCTFSPPQSVGWGARDLFRRPWSEVLARPDLYFPHGALQLRVDLWMEEEGEGESAMAAVD